MKIRLCFEETKRFTAEFEVGTAEIAGDEPTEAEVIHMLMNNRAWFDNVIEQAGSRKHKLIDWKVKRA